MELNPPRTDRFTEAVRRLHQSGTGFLPVTDLFNVSLRLSAIILAALITTCGCFYLMLLLITHNLSSPTELDPVRYVKPAFTRPPAEEREFAARSRPEKITPVTPPPAPDGISPHKPEWIDPTVEKPTLGSLSNLLGPADTDLILEAPHSDLTPIFVVQPVYPLSAAKREQEGFVVVEFAVKESGDVLNPIVVDAEPKLLFNEAALNAISRFRFAPRKIGGEPVRVEKVQLKFTFNLESLYEVIGDD